MRTEICIILLGIFLVGLIATIINHIIETWNEEPELKKFSNSMKNIQLKNDLLKDALERTSTTTDECAKAFEKLGKGLTTVNEIRSSVNYPPIIQPANYRIQKIDNPKCNCQCDYCGTYYEKFISNCKNCGAVIRKPEGYRKLNFIIKTDTE